MTSNHSSMRRWLTCHCIRKADRRKDKTTITLVPNSEDAGLLEVTSRSKTSSFVTMPRMTCPRFTDHTLLPTKRGTCRCITIGPGISPESHTAYDIETGPCLCPDPTPHLMSPPQQGSSSAGGRQLLTDPLQMTGRMHTVRCRGGGGRGRRWSEGYLSFVILS